MHALLLCSHVEIICAVSVHLPMCSRQRVEQKCVHVCVGERGFSTALVRRQSTLRHRHQQRDTRERQRERERQIDRERQRETETETETDRDRDRERQRQTETDHIRLRDDGAHVLHDLCARLVQEPLAAHNDTQRCLAFIAVAALAITSVTGRLLGRLCCCGRCCNASCVHATKQAGLDDACSVLLRQHKHTMCGSWQGLTYHKVCV